MLARIAHELFWLGRNLARAEHTARMLDGVFQASLQGRPDDPAGVTLDWSSLLAIMAASPEDGRFPRRDEVLHALTLDPDNPASVIACVSRAREGARTVRDVISAEMWEAVNTTNLELREVDLSGRLRTGPSSVYGYVKERCALFWGLTSRTMLRDEASAFLSAGGRIESGDMVLRMLRVSLPRDFEKHASTIEQGQALALLQAVGGFQAYRRTTPQSPVLTAVAQFLLYDGTYPGSVASSLQALRDALATADSQPRSSPPVLRLGRLIADLELHRRTGDSGAAAHEMLERVQDELEHIDRDIDERYFAIAALAAVHL